MTTKVEDCKGADVAHAVYVHGELAEEIDDSSCARRESEEQDEWREKYREELGEEDGDLQREKGTELHMDLHLVSLYCWQGRTSYHLRVHLPSPLAWKIMCTLDHFAQRCFRIEYQVFLRHHPTSYCQNRPEDTEVEEHGAMWGDLEVENEIRIDERCYKKYCSE